MADTIELYHPSVSMADAFKVEDGLDDQTKAFVCQKNLAIIRRAQDVMFLAAGKLLKMVRDEKLYLKLDFEHFEEFIASDQISFSRESAYLYIRVYEYYSEFLGLSEEKLKDINLSRLGRMIPILKGIDNKEQALAKIEEMNTLPYNQFIHQVKAEVDQTGKPNVYFSEETNRWVINYYEDKSYLVSLGKYADRKDD